MAATQPAPDGRTAADVGASPTAACVPADPCGWTVAYRVVKGDADGAAVGVADTDASPRVISRDAFAPAGDGMLDVDVAFADDVLEIAVTPHAPVMLETCRVDVRHAFRTDERVLLNGYQSWTTTTEQLAWSRVRGLHGVSRALVDRYVLDGGGDYRFVDYANRPGLQHGWTYAELVRADDARALAASLDESEGFTLIVVDAAHGTLQLRPECPRRALQPGTRTVLGRWCVTSGTRAQCYDRWFALSGIRPRTAGKLVGYTSWYRHYADIDEDTLAADLAGESAALAVVADALEADYPTRRFAHLVHTALEPDDATPPAARPLTAAFQIDDGYCKVGDWLDVDASKFPHGLKPLAQQARAAGLVAGLWVSPFVCERGSRLFLEHNDWLLRDAQGNAVKTGSHWSGAYALDTRNVDVRSYVIDVLSTMVHDWGFGLLKVDFLYAACLVEHDGLNRGQLMADAFGLLRTAVGDDCLILACGVPLGTALGRADFCRIGCDVGLDWDDVPPMRVLHRERISTKNSLANTIGRAPLDGRAFGNDPDVFFLRDDVKLTRDQRDRLLFADADLGSVLLTSDDMGAWDESQLSRYALALQVLLEDAAGADKADCR